MDFKEALYQYCLRIADSNLIIGQRLSECCGHGPILEEDIALTNIALDFIGHATAVLQYAAKIDGNGRNEDELAFLRSERDYRNVLLAEQPNGNFATIIMRQFLFDVYQNYFYDSLKSSKDELLSALAAKFLKEVAYHLRHSTQWVLRLGDGTAESHEKINNALQELWMFTGDLFEMDKVDEEMISAGIGVDLYKVKTEWVKHINAVLKEATLGIPGETFMQSGSRQGRHTEHLGYLLAEMQYLPRTYNDAKW